MPVTQPSTTQKSKRLMLYITRRMFQTIFQNDLEYVIKMFVFT